MTPPTPDLMFTIGLVLVLAAVGVLAGPWWAVGLAGVVLCVTATVRGMNASPSASAGSPAGAIPGPRD